MIEANTACATSERYGKLGTMRPNAGRLSKGDPDVHLAQMSTARHSILVKMVVVKLSMSAVPDNASRKSTLLRLWQVRSTCCRSSGGSVVARLSKTPISREQSIVLSESCSSEMLLLDCRDFF